MVSCDYFVVDIVRPKGFILTDFYILGLPTGIGTMNKLVILSLRRLRGIAVYKEKSKLPYAYKFSWDVYFAHAPQVGI